MRRLEPALNGAKVLTLFYSIISQELHREGTTTMFLGSKALRRALKKHLIVIDNSFDRALKGMTIDIRLGSTILVPELDDALDPLGSADQIKWKTIQLPDAVKENAGKGVVLRQGMLALGYTHERISIERNIVGIINSRSTAARLGIVTHHTAPLINPGHGIDSDGQSKPRSITLELFTSLPTGVKLYAGLVIAQLKFAWASEQLDFAYDARPGATYTSDHGIMIPSFDSLIPDPDARQGVLSELMGLRK